MIRLQRPRRVLFSHVAGVLALTSSCAGGHPLNELAKAPSFAPSGEAKCSVNASPSAPLIVEWPSAERGRLEARARKGLVAVRYSGCEMKVLPECSVARQRGYQYTPLTTKRDRVKIANADDLYANLPAHAVNFEAKLKRSGQLNVAMTIVGRYEADGEAVMADELAGDCAGATHVLTALTVGAFDFFAGADAAVAVGGEALGIGASGKSSSERETLAQDGDDTACGKASGDDKRPPDGCGALLRVEVVPIGKPRCPAGTRAQGDDCVARVDTACPAGLRFEKGVGCVDATPKVASAGAVTIAPAAVVPMARIFGLGTETLFTVDQTEVTVAAYEACVGSGRCSRDDLDKEYACNWSRRERADHPINCVSWAQASSYCAWLGKRLPTEIEWVRAAHGDPARTYPWGDRAPYAFGSMAIAPCWAGVPSDAVGDKRVSTCAVKAHPSDAVPNSVEPIYDLGGNVREWTATSAGAAYVVRGGGWSSTTSTQFERGARSTLPADRHANDVGFRCVK